MSIFLKVKNLQTCNSQKLFLKWVPYQIKMKKGNQNITLYVYRSALKGWFAY